jgi:hypothetical protein
MVTDVTIHVNITGGQATAIVHMVGHTIQDAGTVSGCKLYNHETFSVQQESVPRADQFLPECVSF